MCYLRYDDTNPGKADKRYITLIQEMVEWLGEYVSLYGPCGSLCYTILPAGHTPDKVTFASDYFPELYQLARKLVSSSLAYVCHQPPGEVRGHRQPVPSPWRDRPVEESLHLLEVMS